MDENLQISDEILDEIKQAIEYCYWKHSQSGIDICKGECLPCSRCIDLGKCETIREVLIKHRGIK